MDLGLKDKIIIVTGGSKGIGAGIVSLLAKEAAFPIIAVSYTHLTLPTILLV